MPPEMTPRPVPAPAKDWLSESEVMVLLGGISSRTLDRMIAEGRFPAGQPWGRSLMWRWVDVAWYYLGQEIGPRLLVPPADAEGDNPTPPERQPPPPERQPPPPERQPDANQRHSRAAPSGGRT